MSNTTMGEIISTKRKEAGMTQLQLAEKLAVTDKAVSKWERNLSCPDVETLPVLADVLGISVESLLKRSTQDKAAQENTSVADAVFRAVPLAMGVALTVLSFMKIIDIYTGFSLAGIAITVSGLDKLRNK